MPSTTARPRTSSSSTRIDTTVLFPTPTGRIWWERNFYRDVWQPAREASGLDCTPHDFRHSWVTHLRAAGIDASDLAEIAGHTSRPLPTGTPIRSGDPTTRSETWSAETKRSHPGPIAGQVPLTEPNTSGFPGQGRGFEARRPL
jgi:hypothetical protein